MLEFLVQYGYYGLFIASFLASTVLPFSSEVVLAGCIIAGLDPFFCLIAATIGNFAGGLTTYYLGYIGKIEWVEKYLKVKKEKIEETQQWLNNKSTFISFFSFIPFFGDIIPLALGFMKASLYKVSLGMFLGKLLRYIVVIYISNLFII